MLLCDRASGRATVPVAADFPFFLTNDEHQEPLDTVPEALMNLIARLMALLAFIGHEFGMMLVKQSWLSRNWV